VYEKKKRSIKKKWTELFQSSVDDFGQTAARLGAAWEKSSALKLPKFLLIKQKTGLTEGGPA